MDLFPLSRGVLAAATSLCIACSSSSPDSSEPDAGPPLASGSHEVGAFEVQVADDQTIRVVEASRPEHVLLETRPDFVEAWAVEDELVERSGSFQITEAVDTRCTTSAPLRASAREGRLELTTSLACEGKQVPVRLTFEARSALALGFELAIEPPGGSPLDQVVLALATRPEERFVGFGEQFTYVNLRGKVMPILVQEGGMGRAPGTVADQIDRLSPGSGGSFYSSYAPMPFYFTDRGRSLLLENSELSWFDLSAPDVVRVRLRGAAMRGRVLAGQTPLELVRALTEYTGRMPALPEWTGRGAIVGLQGGTERVREVVSALETAGVPVAALWLQDWVGKRSTLLGSRLWWNWQLNTTHYPGWSELVAELEAKQVRVLSYVNPYLVDVAGDVAGAGAFTRNLYAEARDAGYLVRNAAGEPYEHTSGTFGAGIVDLTNMEAVDWLKDVVRTEILGAGVSGYMADFGEALPFDAVLADGDPALEHNLWPERWARLHREVLEQEGLLGDAFFFSRSGYSRTAGLSTAFWAGDQMVNWDPHDGMASALTALLSGGLSGISINHADIGGYTSFGDVTRSQELLLRWIEWSAFTALFRTHEGNQPDAPQAYAGEAALAHFARFSRLFAALAPYRKQLMEEAQATGAPLVRHLLLEYPDDPRAWDQQREFMLGADVLVAPVLAPAATDVTLYLPEGEWVHLFTDETYGQSGEVTVAAPLGEPAVFYRAGSAAGSALKNALAP
jgi:alpha-glucosidase